MAEHFSTDTLTPVEHPIQASEFSALLDDQSRLESGGNIYRANSEQWIDLRALLHLATTDDGTIAAGCVTHQQNDGVYLSAVAANPKFMGQGAGGTVVDEAINAARKLNAPYIDLVLRLTDDGLPAGPYHIYKARGFRLLPGVSVNAVGWEEPSRHIFKSADTGLGTFRSRTMRLDLRTDKGAHDA